MNQKDEKYQWKQFVKGKRNKLRVKVPLYIIQQHIKMIFDRKIVETSGDLYEESYNHIYDVSHLRKLVCKKIETVT